VAVVMVVLLLLLLLLLLRLPHSWRVWMLGDARRRPCFRSAAKARAKRAEHLLLTRVNGNQSQVQSYEEQQQKQQQQAGQRATTRLQQ
jgi:hypothetical protein